MSTRICTACVAVIALGVGRLTLGQGAPNELITNAGWECVPGARVADGALVLQGGAAGFATLNDNAVRLETRPDVTIALALEASAGEPGFSGLNFWNSLPPAGDAAAWYSTAAKISIGLQGARPSIRVFDGTSSTPAFQFTMTQVQVQALAPGPVSLSVGREGDELVLRVAGAEAARTKVLGSLGLAHGGPLFFGPITSANKSVTIRRFVVTDGAHPNGAEIVRAAGPTSPSNATATLKAAAAARGREIGVGLSQRPLRWDPRVRDVAAREFNLLSGIDEFVFNQMRPARDRYRFCGADQLVAFAEANKVPVHAGSGLLWGRNPDWLTQGNFSRAELIDIMHEHIQTVVGRYRGRVQIWNVVNEVHDNLGGFQKGDQQIWMRIIGPEYIDMAFRWAHEADPQATLVFNSNNDEGTMCAANCGPGRLAGSPNVKADGLYNTVKDLLKRGVPIHGVGMQTHRGDFQRYPNVVEKSIAAQMKRLGDLGLNVYITEMDVPIAKPITAAKSTDQANTYSGILRTCLAAPNCKSLIVFGLDDGNWSEPPSFARAGSMQAGQLTAPLLFDADFKPKPAYNAMLTALRR